MGDPIEIKIRRPDAPVRPTSLAEAGWFRIAYRYRGKQACGVSNERLRWFDAATTAAALNRQRPQVEHWLIPALRGEADAVSVETLRRPLHQLN